MSNKSKGWPVITQIFQQAPEPHKSTSLMLWLIITRGFVVLAVLKLISYII